GIDFEVGLSNCMNDRDSLREKMKEFVANDKTSELEKLFESKDLKNYQIQTHALKSTAQVIGAIEVSEIAKSLEMLAKDQKFDESKHHDLLKKYRELLHQLKLIFGIEEESVEDQVEEQIEKCPGIDFEVGLSNCMEDPEFLREMMEEFIANDKTSELDKLFESKDLKNYQIQTHALKSTSQVIGAIELSEISKSLELNAKNQILDETKHSEMIDAYRKLLANLKKYLEADARA
ncbi:MAG: Hpt domain-containing protein, partial [Selenomonadaceae bacterium]|nr:Hpt domain-containing protein [Selenomonadaceae bacterium]